MARHYSTQEALDIIMHSDCEDGSSSSSVDSEADTEEASESTEDASELVLVGELILPWMRLILAMSWPLLQRLLATKALQSQMQALETMKPIGTTSTKTTTDDADALASRIEVLVASIKRRSQRLYKDTDGNKARARIRCKIRKEKEILTSVVESYNRMAPSTETLCLENILSEENAWPWQLPHSDSVDLKTKRRAFDIVNAIRRLQEEKKIVLIEMDHHWRALQTRGDGLKELSCLLSNLPWVLSEEGLRGLQSTILRKRQNITERKLQARACYLQVWSGAEHVNVLHRASADDYDSHSDSDMD
ncbi:hypothetical protein JOQ06_011147 [Pogonophryne albipinna]|uniref:Uncharacterized protein n=1 Tax=Pogonophryne albipinna TaxID=1090488 RepID=A0AAD6AVB8_9TELE|nr:hypothetical protein JOQ06_011147 [Pogonophryne albipinna]